MVINCVMYGCKSVQKSGDNSVSFHRFPHKRPDILAKWVLAIGREDWQPSKYNRLCSLHFTESSYKIRPGAEVKYLREDAVPTLHCNSISWESVQEPLITIKMEMDESEINLPEPATVKCETFNVEHSIQTVQQSLTIAALRRKVKILQCRLRRRDHKISCMKELIKTLRKKVKSIEGKQESRNNIISCTKYIIIDLKKNDTASLPNRTY